MALILAKGRVEPIAHARQAAYLLARWQGFSFPRIGRYIGGRTHKTVSFGVLAATRRADADEEYGDQLQAAWIAAAGAGR